MDGQSRDSPMVKETEGADRGLTKVVKKSGTFGTFPRVNVKITYRKGDLREVGPKGCFPKRKSLPVPLGRNRRTSW